MSLLTAVTDTDRPPPGASLPRLASGVHPEATGTYGPEMVAGPKLGD